MSHYPIKMCDIGLQCGAVSTPHWAFVIRHSDARRASGVCHLLFMVLMESTATVAAVVSPATDITFACTHCTSPLVVDAAAAGMTLPCQKCGKPTVVPAVPAIGAMRPTEPNDRVAELRRQLKENESQRTEVTGYINQLSIQLHRWQLRLQTLEERRQQLENDLQGAR
jgi:hypothetical protein